MRTLLPYGMYLVILKRPEGRMLNIDSIASLPGSSKIHPRDSVPCADKVRLDSPLNDKHKLTTMVEFEWKQSGE